MFVAAFLAVLVGAALANPVRDESKDEEWDLYKSMFNKKYNVEDEPLRRMVWERNLAYVNQHNLRADLREFSFRLGMNEYADMTNEEFVKTMNGRLNRTTAKSSQKFLNEDIKDLPDTVDWRTKGYVTPVKNQGQCGSCWAFSTTGSLEGQHFKTKGTLVSLSEQNLVDCSAAEGNQGCNGGLMDQGFEYIKENHGIDTEASYPYTAKDGKCHFNAKNVGATATGFVDIKTRSESALQNAVATVGPISVAIDAGHISFQLYRSGVYSSIFCSQTKLDHGVLAVGYGTYGDKLYWLVKNSWGESWGQNGYIMMARNDDNMCGIATQASYPTV